MLTLTFGAFCDDAGMFSLDDPEQFRQEVANHFKGEELVVEVKKRTRQRSLAQNRWLHGVALPLIADFCGYDRHELDTLRYELLAARYGTVTLEPLVPGGQPLIVPARTSSQLTTAEFADFVDWLVRFAAEKFGVVIPLPDEPVSEDA